ncbi:MAG: response regulator [Gemmatimonadota bacterium]
MSEPIKILLADDHALFRAGIRALLETDPEITVIGEASTGDEAVELARSLRPDVVVMDLSMEGSDGLEAVRLLAALELDTSVLVLTMHNVEEYLLPAVEAGADGFVTKSIADHELIEAIRVVARGEVYLPPRATRLLLEEYKAGTASETNALHSLTPREQSVLSLTAEGFSAREIAKKLSISEKTVATYRSRAMEKLGLSHRSEVVRFALRVGLLRES